MKEIAEDREKKKLTHGPVKPTAEATVGPGPSGGGATASATGSGAKAQQADVKMEGLSSTCLLQVF